jgi:metal-dependent hydrolase (beta-lactamase superfamily II)
VRGSILFFSRWGLWANTCLLLNAWAEKNLFGKNKERRLFTKSVQLNTEINRAESISVQHTPIDHVIGLQRRPDFAEVESKAPMDTYNR